MDNENLLTLAESVNKIIKQAGGINELFFEFARPSLAVFMEKLHLNETQAALFANLLYIFEGDSLSLKTISKQLNLKRLEVLRFMDDLEVLVQTGLITMDNDNCSSIGKFHINLPLNIITLIQKNKLDFFKSKINLSIADFFAEIDVLLQRRYDGTMSYNNSISLMKRLFADNSQLSFVKKIQACRFSDEDTFIFLRFFDAYVNENNDELDLDEIRNLYEYIYESRSACGLLKRGTHEFFKKGFIENTNEGGFANCECFKLTEAVKDEFLAELDLDETAASVKGLKRCTSIAVKELFYPEKTAAAIHELTSLLQENNFKQIQDNLTQNGMRTGFACLFSGSPGTGKTETVYQIARRTGRDIMQVDISDTKSMWFGESEKKIKEIFNSYRRAAKKSRSVPILLFNEADAVIGTRKTISETGGAVDQTENAIQNIILQELENLDGILIATTNLNRNLDKAFNRRFLYKIEFEKPTAEIRSRIWKNLVSGLSDTDALTLAQSFDFSGGQIENISRRRTIDKVLNNREVSLEKIIAFCEDEKPESGVRTIGYV